MRGIRNSKTAPTFSVGGILLCAFLLALASASAVWLCYARGWTLYYGDAECHLDIARRVVDAQTPGYAQIGTVWLPLTHWAMLPFVKRDDLWHNGLAGSIPFACCFVIAGTFLFAAVRRIFESTAAGAAAAAVCALNPNLLYIQATPMSEAMFFACLTALLYFTVRFRETQAGWAVAGAGIALCLGTLTRYDGWFLIPFVGLYFLCAAREHRLRIAIVFCLIASLGPLFWMVHNWRMAGDPLDFFRGPYSAKSIQGSANYPGKGYWPRAFQFYGFAAYYCVGPCLAVLGVLGVVAALAKRAFWPVILLLLPPAFYLCSMYSGGTPIFVPFLYSGAYYNVRYGLSILPLLAVASAALVAVFPRWMRSRVALAAVAIATIPWLIHPNPQNWIVFEEGDRNYRGHRQLEHQVEDYLRPRYVRGSGIVSTFGATTAIYRDLGIPLRETLTSSDGAIWDNAQKGPDRFSHQQWAVVVAGDATEKAVKAAGCFTMMQTFKVTDAPEIHLYQHAARGTGAVI